jgi:hypothetical protein
MADPNLEKCPVCLMQLPAGRSSYDHEKEIYRYLCAGCSRFESSWHDVHNLLDKISGPDRVRLSGSIRERYETGAGPHDTPFVNASLIGAFINSAPAEIDVATKARKLLMSIARHANRPGVSTPVDFELHRAMCYAADRDELIYFCQYLLQMKWVEGPLGSGSASFTLTPTGWEEVRRRPRIDSPNGFVAMRFHCTTDDAYAHGIKPAIETDCKYNCQRIDAMHFNGDISDKLMAEIREARFVVADLTGHRRGVYFEAGFAMGLGIDVIWTCYSPCANRTHFDAEHFNQIRWDTPADLRAKLATRIRATIGLGPVDRRVVTAENDINTE